MKRISLVLMIQRGRTSSISFSVEWLNIQMSVCHIFSQSLVFLISCNLSITVLQASIVQDNFDNNNFNKG